MLMLVCQHEEAPVVALPVAASRHAEQVVERAGGTLVWTKLSGSDLMEKSSHPAVTFGASQDGGFIFPRFLPAFDASAAFVHLLGLLGGSGRRLSDVVHALPRVHISHEAVVTPWEQKGLVMRSMVERNKERRLVLVDGVKVLHDDGWALVLPDPEEPVTHVWAEGETDGAARARAQEQARRIRQYLR